MCQFSLFIISFGTRIIYFVVIASEPEDGSDQKFMCTFVNLLMFIPWDLLPIYYILWCHRCSYMNQIAEESSDASFNNVEASD